MLKKQSVLLVKKEPSLLSKILILCLLTCLIPVSALASKKQSASYQNVLELDVKQALPFIKQASYEKDEAYLEAATKKWTTDETLYVLDELLKEDSSNIRNFILYSGIILGIVERSALSRFGEIVNFLESKLEASDVSSQLKNIILESVFGWLELNSYKYSKFKSKSKLLASPKILEEALLGNDVTTEGRSSRIIAKMEITQALSIIKQSIEHTQEIPKNIFDDSSRFYYVFEQLFKKNLSASAVLQAVAMFEDLIDHKKPEVRGQTVYLTVQLKEIFDLFYHDTNEGEVVFTNKEVAVIENSLQSIILRSLNDKNASVQKLAKRAARSFEVSGSKFSAKDLLLSEKICKQAFAKK